jgi:hypothetical protein
MYDPLELGCIYSMLRQMNQLFMLTIESSDIKSWLFVQNWDKCCKHMQVLRLLLDIITWLFWSQCRNESGLLTDPNVARNAIHLVFGKLSVNSAQLVCWCCTDYRNIIAVSRPPRALRNSSTQCWATAFIKEWMATQCSRPPIPTSLTSSDILMVYLSIHTCRNSGGLTIVDDQSMIYWLQVEWAFCSPSTGSFFTYGTLDCYLSVFASNLILSLSPPFCQPNNVMWHLAKCKGFMRDPFPYFSPSALNLVLLWTSKVCTAGDV